MFIYLIAYLLGSLQGGVILSKLLHVKDPRLGGSKNTGATNMWRLHGYRFGLTTFIFDVAKMFLITGLFHWTHSTACLSIALLFGVIGHIYPIYHRFKGGKGVASFIAMITILEPAYALLTSMIWLVVFTLTRISGISAIISLLIVFIISTGSIIMFYSLNNTTIAIASLLCLIEHRHNLMAHFTEYRVTRP